MSSIPTLEPANLTAGDRWQWSRSLSDYPAGTWVLTYALVRPDSALTLTATASGTDHMIDIPAATTAAYPAGKFRWQSYVTNGSDRRTIGSGDITIAVNFAAQGSGVDYRSTAEKIVDALESSIASRDLYLANKALSSATGSSQSFQYRTWPEVEQALAYWRGRVSDEKAQLTGVAPRKFYGTFRRA